MTETIEPSEAAWIPVLRDVSRASGHELRNALNALVVNLEVVRSRADGMDAAVKPFIAQAVEQSEESVRLAESTIALLHLVVGAVDTSGCVGAVHVAPRGLQIQSTDAEAQRATRALQPLSARTGITAVTGASAVILSISEKSQEKKTQG